ncbi:transposase [Streptomyces sp. NPDC051639]|uniref:transposase n=1 Tax=unclassified Streptomyces TaxID=2593676 RepID=UPI003443D464
MVDTLILDLLDPEEARTPPMAMEDYSDEFKANAVALYESTSGATYKSIAADLGINRATLREWVLRDRERRGVTATAAKPAVRPGAAVPSDAPDERIRQLEAQWPSSRRVSGSSRPSGTSSARRPSISPEIVS